MGGGFGILLQQLIAQTNTTFDWITLALLVWNFAVVGFIATFWHAPVKINQFYMIAVSVIMACIFTRLPEWTTWAILIALAIYGKFNFVLYLHAILNRMFRSCCCAMS